jgi:bidirectional [NiFe] hydrogenase diaphorase subunit
MTLPAGRIPMAIPSGRPADNRLRILDATIKRHRRQPDALLEVLHTAQELFGYLDRDTLTYIGRALRVPPSRVFGVATFYNFFSLKPKGAHTCVVCLGTACYVKGADRILAAVQRAHGVSLNGTTSDGQLSLATARCIGACGLAPAVVLDNDIAGRMTPEATLTRIASWMSHDR